MEAVWEKMLKKCGYEGSRTSGAKGFQWWETLKHACMFLSVLMKLAVVTNKERQKTGSRSSEVLEEEGMEQSPGGGGWPWGGWRETGPFTDLKNGRGGIPFWIFLFSQQKGDEVISWGRGVTMAYRVRKTYEMVVSENWKWKSLEVQCLRPRTLTASIGGTGLMPGWGTKIPHSMQHGRKNKRKSKVS